MTVGGAAVSNSTVVACGFAVRPLKQQEGDGKVFLRRSALPPPFLPPPSLCPSLPPSLPPWLLACMCTFDCGHGRKREQCVGDGMRGPPPPLTPNPLPHSYPRDPRMKRGFRVPASRSPPTPAVPLPLTPCLALPRDARTILRGAWRGVAGRSGASALARSIEPDSSSVQCIG